MAPICTGGMAPICTGGMAPICTGGMAPICTGGMAPICTGGMAPICTGGMAPICTGGMAPICTGGMAPICTGGMAPICTGGMAPICTGGMAHLWRHMAPICTGGMAHLWRHMAPICTGGMAHLWRHMAPICTGGMAHLWRHMAPICTGGMAHFLAAFHAFPVHLSALFFNLSKSLLLAGLKTMCCHRLSLTFPPPLLFHFPSSFFPPSTSSFSPLPPLHPTLPAFCLSGPPVEGSIQLVGGCCAGVGILHTLSEGVWLPVCADGWGRAESHVACRQLGYEQGAMSQGGY